eukprot:TRINITY_DN1721_c0_g1_i1.p1 TRINITY_DN1721_c0_g1~~TRINITY_DN1721_c0_g1_i1.p1  ORF type:complete len:504 (+),score=111.40 TRINITY_DN1721_c0_g1_i1:151-1662(+)
MGCGASSTVSAANNGAAYEARRKSFSVTAGSPVGGGVGRTQMLESELAAARGKKCRRRMTAVMPEFRAHIKRFAASKDHPPLSEPRLRKIFSLIDDDSNGVLDVAEVRLFWKRMGWANSEGSIRTMFGIADGDGNGSIDYKEFAKFFRSLSSLEDLTVPDADRDLWVPPAMRKPAPLRKIRRTSLEYLVGHGTRVTCVAVDPTRAVYVSCGASDHDVTLAGIQNGAVHRRFRRHTGPIFSLAISEGAKLLATCGRDGMLYIWNFISGLLMAEIVSGLLTSLAFGKHEGLLYGGCELGTVVSIFIRNPQANFRREPIGKGAVVNLVCMGESIGATASQEPHVYILDRNLVVSRTISYHDSIPTTLAANADRSLCLSVCQGLGAVWSADPRNADAAPQASFSLAVQEEPAAARRGSAFQGLEGTPPKNHAHACWSGGVFLSGPFSNYVCLACNDRCFYFFNAREQTLDWTMEVAGLTYELAWCEKQESIVAGDVHGNVLVAKVTG